MNDVALPPETIHALHVALQAMRGEYNRLYGEALAIDTANARRADERRQELTHAMAQLETLLPDSRVQ